ncbi:alkaline phosphatase D family protein [Streptomyces sp. NPDC003032]
MALNVSSVWTGASTATTAQLKARLTAAGSGTLLVADNEAMTAPATFGPVASGADNVLTFNMSGLSSNTRYWAVVDDGDLNISFKAHFLTHPGPAGEPLSYIFGAAGDAGLTGDGYDGDITNAVSNSPVFDTMRVQGDAEQWLWFSHLGDLHYRNIATNSVAAFRTAYFENMNYGPVVGNFRQSDFFRSVASTYVWDDHDFGPNNSDRTSASRPAAQQVYREWVPHYPLADAAGIWQSWQVGRVLYIASDVRSYRDPNGDPVTPAKTMLGSAQKAWMEALLASTSAEALVWQCPSRWLGGSDTWESFAYERAEMVQLFGDLGWLDRMIFMTADMHATSICSGPNNPVGRFPMFMFASLDAGSWSTGAEYDIGSVAGRRQYGTMRVQDNGHTIALTGTGYKDGAVLMSHTAYVHVGSPVLALSYTAGHVSPPLEPTDDDQGLRNDVTAKREDGGEAHYAKQTGPLNINDPAVDPDGVGVYDEGVTVNVARDEQLADQAGWRVHLGTVDEARYPLVHIDLAANPDLADQVAGLSLGDRLTIANPPPWLPPDQIQLIAEGGTETIGLYDWNVELNASPGSTWNVAQLPPGDASTAGPNRPNRLDTSGSHLVSAITNAATELLVHTPPEGRFTRAPWIISTGPAGAPALQPAHFPFDVRLGGEIARVSACAPAAWDAFTRTTANGWGSSTAGQAWTSTGGSTSDYSTNGSVGLHSMGSLNVSRSTMLTAPSPDLDVRVEGSTPVLAAGGAQYLHLAARWLDGSNHYAARLGFTTSQTLELVLQKRVGGTLTDLVTVTVPGKHTAAAFYTIRFQLDGSTLRAKAWPRGLAEPDGWHVEAADAVLTAAGSVGVRTILSPANTNPLPLAVSYDNFEITTPQRMTVQRSINTVTKAQTAHTAVLLAQPAVVAL